MTERKAVSRPKRTTSGAGIPHDIEQWFRHGGAPPWLALLPQFAPLMPQWFAVWRLTHPEAKPPAGFGWIANPLSRQFTGEEMRAARRTLALLA